MASQMQSPEPASSDAASQGWTIRATTVAAAAMILIGAFQALVGLVAIFEGRMYVIEDNSVYQLDATTSGWIQLILGAVLLLAGSVGWRARRATATSQSHRDQH